MLLVGYQLLLLFYGALLGQWAFFWKYERKLLEKLGIPGRHKKRKEAKLFIHEAVNKSATSTPRPAEESKTAEGETHPSSGIHIAIFASGAGSNAERIIAHFAGKDSIRVGLIVCNKPGAGVLQIAADHGIETLLIEKERFFRGDAYVPELTARGIGFVVLAGFLWKIPGSLIAAYPRKIINLHPALLPKYGGKGMYGMNVHEAVIAAKEKESGITIHYVNEHFDEGEAIFQASCAIAEADTPELLAQKIHALEHLHFPIVIEKLILQRPQQ
ncbi:phosphoribosylglycinamide formyltransferase [Sediminibacterium sp. WSJ-3]|nr:phosphoribosylglycinamide formyltransferase [Sediminibacterium soli]